MLTNLEKKALEILMISTQIVPDVNDDDLSYTKRALKRRKTIKGNPQHLDTHFLVPTSCNESPSVAYRRALL